MTNTAGIPGDRICSFIERVEHIDEEIKTLNEGKKEVFAEAKGAGFDVLKVLKEILRLRKQDKDERDEQDSCSISVSQEPWRAPARRKQKRRRGQAGCELLVVETNFALTALQSAFNGFDYREGTC